MTSNPISKSRHYVTLNVSETVRDTDVLQTNTNRDAHMPYSRVSFRMTLSNLEWLSDSWASCC